MTDRLHGASRKKSAPKSPSTDLDNLLLATNSPQNIAQLQRVLGNQAVMRLFESATPQDQTALRLGRVESGHLVQRGRGKNGESSDESEDETNTSSDSSSSESEESVEDYDVPDDDEEESYDDEGDDPSFVVKESKGKQTYRSGIGFYDTQHFSTRRSLTELQSDKDGNLHSEPGGKGTVIPLDRQGREVRKHQTKGAKNRQPDIDHKMDFLINDQAIEELNYPMSPDTREEFREFVYNDPENLQIRPHSEHKSKRTFRRDSIKPSKLKEAKNRVKKKLFPVFDKKRKRYSESMSDKRAKKKFRVELMDEHKSMFDELYKRHPKDGDDDDKKGGSGGKSIGVH